MTPTLFAQVQFGSMEDWDNFALNHGIAHDTTYRAMLGKNLVPFFLPLYDFRVNAAQDYLLDHYAVHQSNARLLQLPAIPDISVTNLQDERQFSDWMNLHALIHAAENTALGISV